MKTLCWLLAALLAVPTLAADVFEHPRTPAQAQTDLRAAMPDLGQVQVLRGTYKQRKFLREIPRPLTSTGEFLLVRDRGIWWHTQTPLDSELTLTKAGLLEQSKSRSSAKQPGAEVASSIFFALFALDLDTLARSFELFVMPAGSPPSSFLLGLRPRDAALAAWFQQATLSGRKQIEQVTLFEAAGDRTEIDLDATAQPLANLSSIERQRFEP
ncbi:MAG: outer membrane lipoprotein carrier protein LolA [Panacagrimonas sp.]